MPRQKRFYRKGDIVRIVDDECLPRLTIDEMRKVIGPLKVLDTYRIPVDGYPFMQDLSLEGIEKYLMPSEHVELVKDAPAHNHK